MKYILKGLMKMSNDYINQIEIEEYSKKNVLFSIIESPLTVLRATTVSESNDLVFSALLTTKLNRGEGRPDKEQSSVSSQAVNTSPIVLQRNTPRNNNLNRCFIFYNRTV